MNVACREMDAHPSQVEVGMRSRIETYRAIFGRDARDNQEALLEPLRRAIDDIAAGLRAAGSPA